MTQPINIEKYHGTISQLPDHCNPLLGEQGPFFGYVETLENGNVLWSISRGTDGYIDVGRHRQLPTLCFLAEKDHSTCTIDIEITSLSLRQAAYRAILNQAPSADSVELDFNSLLEHYDALKYHLQRLVRRWPDNETTVEFSLLVNEFLLERTLYEGIAVGSFCDGRGLSPTHLQDIHRRNLDTGFREIEAYFSMGLVPDKIHDEYLRALDAKFSNLAFLGDLKGLVELCEPIVRVEGIKVPYDPSLLAHILDCGHLNVYMYILDLVDLTREHPTDQHYPDLPDVTYDPFHIAIRLGKVDAVRCFVSDGAFFEGLVSNDIGMDSVVLAPLSATVHWNQPLVASLLLKAGPLYLSSFEQSLALALTSGSEEMMHVFSSHQRNTPVGSSSRSITVPPPSFSLIDSVSPGGNWRQPSRRPSQHLSTESDDLLSALNYSSIHQSSGTNSNFGQLPTPDYDVFTPMTPNTFDFLSSSLSSGPNIELLIDEPMEAGWMLSEIRQGTIMPPEQSYLSQCDLYRARRLSGRRLVEQLNDRRKSLLDMCSMSERSQQLLELGRQFQSLEMIWESGTEVFRQLLRSNPPPPLAAVIQAMLVADALSVSLPSQQNSIKDRFTQDLATWRCALAFKDQHLLDKVAIKLWGVDPEFSQAPQRNDTDWSYHNVHLLLCEGDLLHKPFDGLRQSGVRLREIAIRIGASSKKSPERALTRTLPSQTNFQSIGTVLGQLTKDTDSADDDDLDIGDYVDLAVIEEEPKREARPRQVRQVRQVQQVRQIQQVVAQTIDSPTKGLLTSVAFSIILSFITMIHCSPTPNKVTRDHDEEADMVSLDETFEAFFSLESSSSRGKTFHTSHNALPFITKRSRISEMKVRCQGGKNPKSRSYSQRLMATSTGSQRSILPSSMSSPDGPSFLSATDLSSTDTGRSNTPRRHCLSTNCPKTFSSISNRNKHMREGCPFRDKKGYRCRNGDCGKVLTTKWYRNTHEQTRCRYRL